MFAVLVVAVIVLLISSVYAIDYCDLNLCSNGLKHIACNHSGNFASTCPADKTMINFSNNEIQQILDIHNTMRNKIASGGESKSGFKPASKMSMMYWNADLAELAALNVKQCKMQHDQCRNTLQFRTSGQNLGFRASTGPFEGISSLINNVVWAWYNEIEDTKPSDVENCCGLNLNKVGHFLQLLQDQSTFIGCAASRYTNGPWKTILLACNYSFSNYLLRPVYVSGAPASQCGNRGTNSKFTALCN